MTSKTKLMIAAAAMSGLLAGSAARSLAAVAATPAQGDNKKVSSVDKAGAKALADTADKGKHDCKGKNDCKGQGGCKTGDAGCKGKNSCKGKGGCATNKEEKKDAKLVAAGQMAKTLADTADKHDCKGKNDCKGKGGCKTGDNGCKGKNSCKGNGGCATNKDSGKTEKL